EHLSARQLERPVPARQPIAAAHARARPRDPVTVRRLERRTRVGRDRPDDVEATEHVDALDRAGADGAARDAHRLTGLEPPPRAHRETVHEKLDVDPLRGADAVAAPR